MADGKMNIDNHRDFIRGRGLRSKQARAEIATDMDVLERNWTRFLLNQVLYLFCAWWLHCPDRLIQVGFRFSTFLVLVTLIFITILPRCYAPPFLRPTFRKKRGEGGA